MMATVLFHAILHIVDAHTHTHIHSQDAEGDPEH